MVISAAGGTSPDAVTRFWKTLIHQNQALLRECVVSSPKNKNHPACLPGFLPVCPVSSQLANGLEVPWDPHLSGHQRDGWYKVLI